MTSNVSPLHDSLSKIAKPLAPVPLRLLRRDELESLIGLKRSQIHRLESAGLFPQRRAIGPRSVAWVEAEVMAWIGSRPTKAVQAKAAT